MNRGVVFLGHLGQYLARQRPSVYLSSSVGHGQGLMLPWSSVFLSIPTRGPTTYAPGQGNARMEHSLG